MIFISNGDKTSRVLFHQIQHYAYWAIFSSNKHHGFYTLLNLNQDNIDPLIDSCLTLSEHYFNYFHYEQKYTNNNS